MAIVHVSTADGFISAIGTNDNEVYIDNDIDFNGTNFTEQTNVARVTIHGQGHNLSNIQYDYNGNRFYATADSTWDEVNFINCLCQNTADYAFFHGQLGIFNFDKCKFHGKFYNFAYRKTNFTHCAFAFEGGLAWLSWANTGDVSFDQCYFDLKEQLKGHTLITNERSNITIVKNCYFKGKIHHQTVPPFNVGDTTFINNVINFEFVDSGTFKIDNVSRAHATVSIYNATNAAGATITAQTNIVGLTDSDMHATSAADVQRVSEAIEATGFPIIY